MASVGPSIWAVSDGRAGNAAQVRAIANALGSTLRWMGIAHITGQGHRAEPVTLTPGAPWTWLPASTWRAPLLALPKDQKAILTPPWPTVWLGAGRRTAPYSAYVKHHAGDETLVVHMLDPKLVPKSFDLLVTPEHDGVEGSNVLSTLGSPSYFSPDNMEDAGQAFADLADEPGKSALVILGGDSKTHTFTQGAAETLAMQLTALSGQGWRLRITVSRRTPAPILARMRSLADQIGARFWASSADGPNPYLAWLMFSDVAIVTEDSANMLSDAAYHGLPVHMARLHGRAEKFDRLHESLIKRGVARWFDGSLGSWSFEPLREADRVADAIVTKLLERFPRPDMGGGGKVVAPDWL
ncbi:MAG: mitochondrial fission ELM1 family protein [Pseudomonadota bacterium]